VIAKVSVLGHFGRGETLLNGQTVKTKIITEELQRRLGRKQVLKIDTRGRMENVSKSTISIFLCVKKQQKYFNFSSTKWIKGICTPVIIF